PEHGESLDAVLQDMDRIIMPGITHWQSPNFFAYFPSNTSGASILGDLLSSGLNAQGMLWSTSPAYTELETHVMDWVVDLLGLPERFRSSSSGGGVIEDSASSSTLCAVLAARERATRLVSNERGCDGTLVAYASTQTHSHLEKDIRVAGIGSDNMRCLGVDDTYAMDPELLEEAIEADRAAGRHPFLVVATVGTTSSNAIDPLPAIGEICRRYGLWLHVDGAMCGTAAICPEFRWIHEGLELADSYVFNPHKWMFTGFDCSCFFVADRASLINALTILPEYLRNAATASGAVIDYRDWQVPLGRRFRALKLWLMIRHYGAQGIRYHIREHVTLAQEFALWVRDDPNFEVVAPVPLNLVCFRHKAGDEATQAVMDKVNTSGRMFLSHTRIDDRLTLRMCIGQTNTERRHVVQAWELLREAAAGI
ncbi:MAG TPA: pyridoxal-dependent decarboxylase, partial [Thermoleophilia bacterium]|nr:pyridoxal-dependent decarboxylase [Thermoleophilia bacterium]